MFPLLKPGEEVLADWRAYRRHGPQVGDIVVAWHPAQPGVKIIKRVTAVSADGRCQLQGDNRAETTDFTDLSTALILGRVTSLFP